MSWPVLSGHERRETLGVLLGLPSVFAAEGRESAVPSSSIPPRPPATAIGDGAEEAGECPPEGDGHSRPSRPSDEGRPKKGEDGRRAAIFDARRQHKSGGARRRKRGLTQGVTNWAHGAEKQSTQGVRRERGAA